MEFKNMESEDQNINVDKIVGYWVETSDDDFKTMANLFKTKDYHWFSLSVIWYWKNC